MVMEIEILKSALAPTAACLSVADLQTLVEQDAAERVDQTGHLAKCPRCRAELALLESFVAATPLADEGAAMAWISAELERNLGKITGQQVVSGASEVAASWWARGWKLGGGGFAVAATGLAAVLIAAAVWMKPSQPVLVADAGKHDLVMRSQQIERMTPTGDVLAKPTELRWQAVAKAATYKVAVMEVDETILWTAQSSDKFVTLPKLVSDKMLLNKPILWRVSALAIDGSVIATSQIEQFRLTRRGQAAAGGPEVH